MSVSVSETTGCSACGFDTAIFELLTERVKQDQSDRYERPGHFVTQDFSTGFTSMYLTPLHRLQCARTNLQLI